MNLCYGLLAGYAVALRSACHLSSLACGQLLVLREGYSRLEGFLLVTVCRGAHG